MLTKGAVTMETSVASFVSSFLHCLMGEQPTQAQLDLFMAVARRADFEKLTRGDFVIPLNSHKLKELADPTTPFGNFVHNPTEENIKMVERALEACRLPVAKVLVQNSVLRVHLDRTKMIKMFLPRIAKEGLKYGANMLLKQVPVVLRHCTVQKENSSLKFMRGIKIVNHVTRILEFCGAKVDVREKQSNEDIGSKDEEFMVVDHEECEPEAALVVSLESQGSQSYPSEQNTLKGTPVDPTYYYVVNERTSERGLSGSKNGDGTRQKKPRTEAEFDTPPDRQAGTSSEVSDVTNEKIYVMCSPQNYSTAIENQFPYSCVSERLEMPVKNERTEIQRDEAKRREGAAHIQHTSDEEKGKSTSGTVEFVITDSMKGMRNSPWVYQYFGVVDAKTGNPWTGSVDEYCRILVQELKQTSEVRYKEADGPEWKTFLEEQAQRCLSLQLLSPAHSNQLRVEVDGATHNTKEAAFMLYNYARLCSILDSFEQCVQHGDVAPLPPAETVDFYLLRHDDEWELVWLYLLRWPEIIEEMASGILAGSRKLKTAHVFRFLYSLSHRWSEYYGRHQVLSEGFLPHLLPLMYARLHLLHALFTLMRSCFAVLGVTSLPSHM